MKIMETVPGDTTLDVSLSPISGRCVIKLTSWRGPVCLMLNREKTLKLINALKDFLPQE